MTLKEQMILLGWKDITTDRQIKNGTRIYRLPIKKYGQFIEVGSFESGYVRRMNGCYTPYQLNKCEPHVEYYKDYKHSWDEKTGDHKQFWTGKYNKHVGKRRIKLNSTRKRLQYLIDYCLKNYYINQANEIENGNYIPKWKHEYEMKNGDIERVRELQSENRRLHNIYLKQTQEIRELKERNEDAYDNGYNHGYDNGSLEKIRSEVQVIIDGHKYNVK